MFLWATFVLIVHPALPDPKLLTSHLDAMVRQPRRFDKVSVIANISFTLIVS